VGNHSVSFSRVGQPVCSVTAGVPTAAAVGSFRQNLVDFVMRFYPQIVKGVQEKDGEVHGALKVEDGGTVNSQEWMNINQQNDPGIDARAFDRSFR
jgi:hypothetical protein